MQETEPTVINTVPAALITAPAAVCASSTGNVASVPSAVAGATYSWTITNGMITSGAGTAAVKFTAGASGSEGLNVTVNNSTGCTTLGSASVAINPVPPATIIAPATVCPSSEGNAASVPNAGSGAIYVWTVINGTITSGAGTAAIIWRAGTVSPVTLKITVKNAAGCSTTGTVAITNAVLSTAIAAPSSVCPGSTGNKAYVPDAGAGAVYSWSIDNGVITSGTGTATIAWTAGSQFRPITLVAFVTNAAGCTKGATKTITVPATITAPSVVCANSTGNTASVPSAGTGGKYTWTISGGTITSGVGTQTIKFTAGASGSVALGVTVVSALGCSPSNSLTVPIRPPDSTVTASSSVCHNSAGNIASVPSAGSGATYTSGAGSRIIQYTAAGSGTVTLKATVTNGNGCGSTTSTSVAIDTGC